MTDARRYSSISQQYNDYRRSRRASQARSHRSSSPLRFNDYDYVIDDDAYVNNNINQPYYDDPNCTNLPYTAGHYRQPSRGSIHYSQKQNAPLYPYNNYNHETEENYMNEGDVAEDTYNPTHRYNYPPRDLDDTVMDLTDIPIISYPSPSPSYLRSSSFHDNNYYYNNYDSPLPAGIPVADEGIPMPQPTGDYRKYLYRKRTTKNILLSPEGNLIVNCFVPQRALQYARYRNSEEFLSLRYFYI